MEAEELLCDICYNSVCLCRSCCRVGKLCEKDYKGASVGCGYTNESKMACWSDNEIKI